MKIEILNFGLVLVFFFQMRLLHAATNKPRVLVQSTTTTKSLASRTKKVYSTYGLPCSVNIPCISGSNLACKNGICEYDLKTCDFLMF
jgi:hypothetical protein